MQNNTQKKRQSQIDIENAVCHINPEYRLKSDLKRILLYYRHSDPPIHDGLSFFTGFLHPVLAVLLSLFDGKKSLKAVTGEFASLTGLNRQSVLGMVTGLVENSAEQQMDFNGHLFRFPKNTLVRNQGGGGDSIPFYNPTDFLLPGDQLDFSTQRLYEPLDTMLMLNNRCVTRCNYCYADKRKPVSCGIPFERLAELIREAHDLKMRSFTLSGGELFLYKEWAKALKELVRFGFNPYISTKFPLTPEQVRQLRDIGATRIQLSIDTVVVDEAVRMLGVNKKYLQRMRETLGELDRNNFDIRINSQITAINQDSMEPLVRYLTSFKNVNRIRMRATGYSLYQTPGNYLAIRPTREKLLEIEERLKHWEKQYGDNVAFDSYNFPERRHYITSSLERKKADYPNRPQCSGNFQAFNILPDGKVTVCEELYWHPRFIIGDLMKQSIREVWNSEEALALYRFSRDAVGETSACKTCADFDGCHQGKGVCWKQVMYAYGEENWDYPDPRCHLAPEPINEFWID